MVVDIDALITEVRKRPPLYDTSNKEYHDRRMRKELWGEVCACLRTAEIWNSMNFKNKIKYEREVITKWNSLRTCFRRELKINTFQNDGIPEKKKRKYIYFDDLLFLLPFTKVIDTESMLENNDTDPSDLSEEDTSKPQRLTSQTEKLTRENYEKPMLPITKLIKAETLVDIERISESSELSDGDSSITQSGNDFRHPNTKVKIRTHKSDNGHGQIVKEDTRRLENKRVSLLSNVDDDEAFLSSLLPSLKEFSTEEKLRLRIELLTTILNFKKSINSDRRTDKN